jgi:hypothetical protein
VRATPAEAAKGEPRAEPAATNGKKGVFVELANGDAGDKEYAAY